MARQTRFERHNELWRLKFKAIHIRALYEKEEERLDKALEAYDDVSTSGGVHGLIKNSSFISSLFNYASSTDTGSEDYLDELTEDQVTEFEFKYLELLKPCSQSKIFAMVMRKIGEIPVEADETPRTIRMMKALQKPNPFTTRWIKSVENASNYRDSEDDFEEGTAREFAVIGVCYLIDENGRDDPTWSANLASDLWKSRQEMCKDILDAMK